MVSTTSDGWKANVHSTLKGMAQTTAAMTAMMILAVRFPLGSCGCLRFGALFGVSCGTSCDASYCTRAAFTGTSCIGNSCSSPPQASHAVFVSPSATSYGFPHDLHISIFIQLLSFHSCSPSIEALVLLAPTQRPCMFCVSLGLRRLFVPIILQVATIGRKVGNVFHTVGQIHRDLVRCVISGAVV